jgi:AraC-like DNA-binding protein
VHNDLSPFFIPSSYSRIAARVLGLQERQLARLLQGTGLPTQCLLPGDETRLTGQQQLQVLENAQQMGRAADFGLRLGCQLQPSTHGPIGYLALSSPDLYTALKSLQDFLPLRIPFAQLDLQMESAWLRCSLSIKLPAVAHVQRMLLECFALVLQALIETFLGRRLTEANIHFQFDQPDYHTVYPDYLHSPIHFGQPDNGLYLPVVLARSANAVSDPDSFALAQKLCQQLLERVPAETLTMADRVRRLLLTNPGNSISEEDIARALFVSKRTLARRLQREGSGFRQLREELLAEQAARHLCDSSLTVEAIAALLGYHDAANFRRACHRWFGQSPAAFRRQGAALAD